MCVCQESTLVYIVVAGCNLTGMVAWSVQVSECDDWREDERERDFTLVCVCVCARARVCVCVFARAHARRFRALTNGMCHSAPLPLFSAPILPPLHYVAVCVFRRVSWRIHRSRLIQVAPCILCAELPVWTSTNDAIPVRDVESKCQG